jgi:hypothetical protein
MPKRDGIVFLWLAGCLLVEAGAFAFLLGVARATGGLP